MGLFVAQESTSVMASGQVTQGILGTRCATGDTDSVLLTEVVTMTTERGTGPHPCGISVLCSVSLHCFWKHSGRTFLLIDKLRLVGGSVASVLVIRHACTQFYFGTCGIPAAAAGFGWMNQALVRDNTSGAINARGGGCSPL